jgi:ribosomal protein S18 acetylase RimI-like enzyme
MALGSRLRLLTARITDEAAGMYRLYGEDFSPKWFPVFFMLAEEGKGTITDIAQAIGHSQPSVSKIVAELTAAGLVEGVDAKTTDKRRTVVALTEKGAALSASRRAGQYQDVEAAVQSLIDGATHNLWEAIGEWEYLLDQKSLLQRVREQKKLREGRDVRIVEYEARYRHAFKALNEEWISAWFQMEEADHKALDYPEESIIAKGGRIFVALLNDEPVGVCALVKKDNTDYPYELAKMAVSPAAKGRSIGWLLGNAVVQAARETGAEKLYLESNTILKPAISLYQKLGFTKVAGRPSPYARTNIQMELDLGNGSAL